MNPHDFSRNRMDANSIFSRAVRLCACALVVCAAGASLHLPALDAQAAAPADTLYEVRMVDGTRHLGVIVSETAERVVIRTAAGVEIGIPRDRIERIGVARGRVVDGELWHVDPNTSRLFFGPTGRAIPAGDGYVAVYQLFFPFVGYGVTDWLTLAGGTPIFPGAIGEVFYLAPKARVYHDERMDLSVGVLSFFGTRDLTGTVGILYGAGTFGDTDSAFTAGVGWPFYASREDSEILDLPIVMVGGEHRVNRAVKLISENYFFPGEGFGAFSGGVRFIAERLSADAGVALGFGGGNVECCLPVVNFVYNF